MPTTATKEYGNGLVDVLERILDKGLVINADITVAVAGVELLGIKIRAALASFETAARYGLEFPSGTSQNAPAWSRARTETESCPQCRKSLARQTLLIEGCPWCGWQSPALPRYLPDVGPPSTRRATPPTGRTGDPEAVRAGAACSQDLGAGAGARIELLRAAGATAAF